MELAYDESEKAFNLGALNLALGMAGSSLAKEKAQQDYCPVPAAGLWEAFS